AEARSCASLAAVTLAGLAVSMPPGWCGFSTSPPLHSSSGSFPRLTRRSNIGGIMGRSQGGRHEAMSDRGVDGDMEQSTRLHDKRRLMVTQLLRSPVLNPAGTEVGRVEDFIVKLADGTYPPVTGLKVRVGAQDVFIGKDLIDSL